MIDLLAALVGLAIAFFIGGVLWIAHGTFTNDPGIGFIGWGAAVFIDVLAAVYFLVQFIRWAWTTPVSSLWH